MTELWLHRQLIKQLSLREIRSRYQSTVIGLGWTVIAPLTMLLIYTTVFGKLFPSRWIQQDQANPQEFALILFAGLLLFNFFAEVLGRSPGLVVSQPSYVTKIVFPVQLLPVVTVLAATVQLVVSLGLLCLGLLLSGVAHPHWLLIPLAVGPLMLLTLGLAWALSATGVYARDISQLVAMVLAGLLFVSPIFYPISALSPTMQAFILFNPLTVPIEALRDIMVWGRLPNVGQLGVYWAIAVAVAIAGLRWFKWLRKGFSDVL
jgi:lipopolysaccharide transport system permease protein